MRAYSIDEAFGSIADEEVPITEEPELQRDISDLYPKWHLEAGCLGQDDSLFFGASDPDIRPQFNLSDIKVAQEFCADCPVRKRCLTAALLGRERYGVWGGTTPKQRIEMMNRIDRNASTASSESEAFFASKENR